MKIAYILRGIPGSGKSTLARKLAGDMGKIHCADDYFMQGGRYMFNPAFLSDAHSWSRAMFKLSVAAGVPAVVCDNVNAQRGHYQAYVEMAKRAGYEVRIITLPHPSLELAVSQNTHGASLAIIQEMLAEWEPDSREVLYCSANWETPFKQPRLTGALTLFLSVGPDVVHCADLSEFSKSHGLQVKSEFHITVIGRPHGKRIEQTADKEALIQLRAHVQRFSWEFRLLPERFFVEKEYVDLGERRRSIIQIAEVRGLEQFLREVTKMTGVAFEWPFPHVTLYTASSNPKSAGIGIGIYSADEFSGLSAKPIP